MEGFCGVMNCTKGEPHINNYTQFDEVSNNPCSAMLNILFTIIFMFAPCINSIKNTFYCSN